MEECPARNEVKNVSTIREKILYVNAGVCKTPHDARELSTIRRSDNSKAFVIVEKK